jgi:DNA-binding CsgD family transcriptional regulator
MAGIEDREDMGNATSNRSGGFPFAITVGAALFWAWGFSSFLSPSLVGTSPSPEAHIEYAYIASQVTLIATVALMVSLVRRRSMLLRKPFIIVIGGIVALSTAGLCLSAMTPSIDRISMVVLGVVIGVASPFMGIAWGARFSLEGPRIYPAIASSFLASYALYFALSNLAVVCQPAAAAATAALPFCSVLIWYREARGRQVMTEAVWPVKRQDRQPETPGELLAGDTSLALLPKRDISILAVAAFVGNLLPSIILEYSYGSAGNLCYGAFLLGSALAAFALILTIGHPQALSIPRTYQLTLPFTAIGLVLLLVFRSDAATLAGSLVMGSGLFLQVLIYIKMTQSTQEKGFSPVLSFGVGQAIVATSVAIGNLLGKAALAIAPNDAASVLIAVSALSLLLLVFLLTFIFEWREHRTEAGDCDAGAAKNSPDTIAGSKRNADWDAAEREFACHMGLTARETEVTGYLLKGRSIPYTAQAMFVTTGTVKTHVAHIYQKAGINNRQQLLDLYESCIRQDPSR